jgi:predicted ArsR family transcriptional regulator
MQAPTAPPRIRILYLLKRSGGLTAQEIARELGISAVAVRKHLAPLEAQSLITTSRRPGARGRPSLIYTVSEAGERTFPTGYHDLVVDLLDDFNTLAGEQQLDRLFQRRNERLAQTYQLRLVGKSLSEAVHELAKARDAEGYMVTVEEGKGGLVLSEHNCPIISVAQRFPSACQCEHELFEKVLNASLTREVTLAQGGSVCRYRIEDRIED